MVVATSCSNKDTSDANIVNSNSDSVIFDKGIDPNAVAEDVVVTDSYVVIEDVEDNAEIIEELKNEIAGANAICPSKIEEGMIWDKVYDNGSYVIYSYKLDEDLYTISTFTQSKEEIKQNIIAMSDDPAFNQFLKLIIKNNRGLIYRYYGDTSNERVDIKFSVSELKRHL